MLTDLERRNLKARVGMAVKLAGGQDNAANVSARIDRPATFSDYANPSVGNRHVPIDVAVEIDQFNGQPLIVGAAARMLGYELVHLPGTSRSMTALALSIKEGAEAIAAISEMIDEGARTPGPDRERIVREIDEAVRAFLEARARVLDMGGAGE